MGLDAAVVQKFNGQSTATTATSRRTVGYLRKIVIWTCSLNVIQTYDYTDSFISDPDGTVRRGAAAQCNAYGKLQSKTGDGTMPCDVNATTHRAVPCWIRCERTLRNGSDRESVTGRSYS